MIYALEGLRGVAALLVTLFHGWTSSATSFELFRQGWLFVDLFFVISGFVMSHVYLEQLGGTRDAEAFAIKRFGRLYPLHVATLFAFIACEFALQGAKVVATAWGHSTHAANFDLIRPWSLLSNVLLLHGIGLLGERSYNAPSWSISTEIWAYFLFALTTMAFPRRSRVLAWLALSVAGALLWALNGNEIGNGSQFFRCAYGFFLGAVLPRCKEKISPPTRVLDMWQLFLAAASVLLVCSISTVQWAVFAVTPCFAALVLSVSFDRGVVSVVMKAKPLQTLGRLSYSIYMTHWSVLVFFNPVGESLHEPYRSLLKLVFVATVLCVSAFTYRWIELPWRQRFADIAARRRAGVDGPPPTAATPK